MSEFIPEPNIMPTIEIFNPFKPILRALGWLSARNEVCVESEGITPTGGSEMLDRELYSQESLFNANLSGFGYEPE